jgi:hypothetical protein
MTMTMTMNFGIVISSLDESQVLREEKCAAQKRAFVRHVINIFMNS